MTLSVMPAEAHAGPTVTPDYLAARARLRSFLAPIFEEAFADPTFRALLLKRIVALDIDAKLLTTLLQYCVERPTHGDMLLQHIARSLHHATIEPGAENSEP